MVEATFVSERQISIPWDAASDLRIHIVSRNNSLFQQISKREKIMSGRVFFVTGTSSGFGKTLVEEILTQGDKVVATTRNPSSLDFSSATPENFVSVALDVTDTASVSKAFDVALTTFG